VSKKLTRYESLVRGCIVIMEQPIAHAPQFRSFSPNVLPQTGHMVAQWLRHCATNRKVEGSIPDGVTGFCH
jgi:hypothetical protein